MFSIKMGGCDIFLCIQCLIMLGPITMVFLKLYMIFQKDGHSYMLKGLKVDSPKIVSPRCMENLLKKVILTLLHNSMLLTPLKMLLSQFIQTCSQFWINTNQSVNFPNDYHPRVVRMIIVFHCSQVAYNQMCTCIIIINSTIVPFHNSITPLPIGL